VSAAALILLIQAPTMARRSRQNARI
jgi:hypothetical protein